MSRFEYRIALTSRDYIYGVDAFQHDVTRDRRGKVKAITATLQYAVLVYRTVLHTKRTTTTNPNKNCALVACFNVWELHYWQMESHNKHYLWDTTAVEG